MLDDVLSANEMKGIRRRLVAIRTVVAGDNQAEFARRLGIKRPRWANFKRKYPLTLERAVHLTKMVPGLSIEYITEGVDYRLPEPLKRKLRVQEQGWPPGPEAGS